MIWFYTDKQNLKLIINNYSHFTFVLKVLLSNICITHSMISTE